ERALKLLRQPQEFGVTAPRFLPYASILPAFASIYSQIGKLPGERRLQARRKLNHWYWASVFRSRYSSAVESKSTRDFVDVQRWFEYDEQIPGIVREFNEQFRNLDLENETRNASSVYRAIFNLFVIGGARDWLSGDVPAPEEIDDHHIVPASWGAKNELGKAIDTVLNRAPLSAETNRHWISDKLPNAYLPELIKNSGEAAVRANLESHFVSPRAFDILMRDPFSKDDYREFIEERKRTIMSAIEALLVKERLDLSPDLRELDTDVEAVELRLRRLIARRLTEENLAIPDHIDAKVRDRLDRDRRKGLLEDAEGDDELAQVMQYFDLRELEQLMVAKTSWPAFADVFSSREQLSQRFNQLAELRNSIRHSRSVSQIAQRDGEAALLWFESKLKDSIAVAAN
ncbi:hypothetical protein OAS19_00355, partial [Altererythrobacter sp.]|nr:hypothetical protein [Altererythrobacter sp.]